MSVEAKVVSQQAVEHSLKIEVDNKEIPVRLYWTSDLWYVRPECKELSVAELIAICTAVYDCGLVKETSRIDIMVDETKGPAYYPVITCKDSLEKDLLNGLKISFKKAK